MCACSARLVAVTEWLQRSRPSCRYGGRSQLVRPDRTVQRVVESLGVDVDVLIEASLSPYLRDRILDGQLPSEVSRSRCC